MISFASSLARRLSQLTPDQLKTKLTLLQTNQLTIPQPQQRPSTERPLLPAEHNTLNQMVTSWPPPPANQQKLIWRSMLELSGVKAGELIPAKQFTHRSPATGSRQTLSTQKYPYPAYATGGTEAAAGAA